MASVTAVPSSSANAPSLKGSGKDVSTSNVTEDSVHSFKLFEGMKAYRGADDKVRLFRPMLNMNRMAKSAERVCLPAFDRAELVECIRRLVQVDLEWVPQSDSASLYIRPTFLGTEE
uniref:Branched chain amino-acid transaminase 1, cytosolic n=1 Tax=Hucho hucho TaxID=62062 RepID=A0A4W5MN52_9TELE